MQIKSISSDNTEQIGIQIGEQLNGGEVIELISDLGGGKTTLTRGIAKGAGSHDDVASPTFTISRVYLAPKFEIHHFDFYRLDNAGIIAHELEEAQTDKKIVTIIEWGDVVSDVLPKERLRIILSNETGDFEQRLITLHIPDSLAYATKGITI